MTGWMWRRQWVRAVCIWGNRASPSKQARRFVKEKNMGREFLVGVSVHSLESAQAAAANSADYVIFGPVFDTPSKVAFGHPQGVDRFANVCRSLSIPVIAIGGITMQNAGECLTAGAAGIGSHPLVPRICRCGGPRAGSAHDLKQAGSRKLLSVPAGGGAYEFGLRDRRHERLCRKAWEDAFWRGEI